jgi:predicted adenylyl cyclase CyaB
MRKQGRSLIWSRFRVCFLKYPVIFAGFFIFKKSDIMKYSMPNIEIEVRSFITEKEYKRLIKKLNKEAKFLSFINEETTYFKGTGGDLRLRKNDRKAFIIFKKGKIHDDSREEIEIRFSKEDFEKIESLFKKLGLREEVKWFRKRRVYRWKGTKVFLDNTKGYGLIIELEKIGKREENRRIHQDLKIKLKSLDIKITPKKIFNKKFNYYKRNWQKILK